MGITLLLWDIDGTLIDSGGAGEHGLVEGFRKAFGVEDNFAWLSYFGRTDLWIFRTILEHHGLGATPAHILRYREAYLAGLRDAVVNPRARVLPGVREILEAVHLRSDVAQGLLTGNMETGASIKLGVHNIDRYFPFGAFADDSENRNELGPFALRRAAQKLGQPVLPEHTWIIGDTPLDIACARALGAKVLAVATGKFTVEELASHQPDLVLPDLSAGAAVLKELGLP